MNAKEAELLARLLDIIATEGLVDRAALRLDAALDDVNLTADDLILIGNAIEREFDKDLSPADDELQQVTTVRGLVELIARRIRDA
ncbi:MAG TPA: hypothetical protein VGN82_05295 [Bosea sp. (in: a-proteobacteria)]|uniref:hypothetical protein n=1 Tax=Bosea sp. (in: a-proteobacteria) TaxID=1871050 RepID=UPI002E1329C5|nr:hypothetical protein [Bosea sp. (in: a-proteobacteria)]